MRALSNAVGFPLEELGTQGSADAEHATESTQTHGCSHKHSRGSPDRPRSGRSSLWHRPAAGRHAAEGDSATASSLSASGRPCSHCPGHQRLARGRLRTHLGNHWPKSRQRAASHHRNDPRQQGHMVCRSQGRTLPEAHQARQDSYVARGGHSGFGRSTRTLAVELSGFGSGQSRGARVEGGLGQIQRTDQATRVASATGMCSRAEEASCGVLADQTRSSGSHLGASRPSERLAKLLCAARSFAPIGKRDHLRFHRAHRRLAEAEHRVGLWVS